MLETVDLKHKVPKAEFKERAGGLSDRLRLMQKGLRDAKRPAVIVLQGWDGVGRGEVIKHLVERLDPRGFQVHEMYDPTPDERRYPFLWRYWLRLPAYGKVAIFSRSWYRRVLEDRVLRRCSKADWRSAYDDINHFEQILAADGYLILKFWLHISKKEQAKRFAAFAKDPLARWRVDSLNGEPKRHYDRYYQAAEEMLERTETAWAPWTLVGGTDRRHMVLTVMETVATTWERALEQEPASPVAPHPGATAPTNDSVLEHVDLTQTIDRKAYSKELGALQVRARELEFACHRAQLPVVILFEGWDAGGKGGAIKRLTAKLDPRGYGVIPIQAPAGEEAVHHYLWRFWHHVPKTGHWAIFDRSWYGRVLVERVEGFASEAEWHRAYQEINTFERALSNFGMVVIKFWMHLSKEEQLARFETRRDLPHKAYKLTDEDWRNREKWDEYLAAVNAMVSRTSTTYAPWTIVAAESKLVARIQVLRTVVAAVEAGLHAKER